METDNPELSENKKRSLTPEESMKFAIVKNPGAPKEYITTCVIAKYKPVHAHPINAAIRGFFRRKHIPYNAGSVVPVKKAVKAVENAVVFNEACFAFKKTAAETPNIAKLIPRNATSNELS